MSDIPSRPHILSIGTAVPRHRITQDDILVMLKRVKGDLPDRMENILLNTGIRQRFLAMPLEAYFTPRSWDSRAGVYDRVSAELFRQAASSALEGAGLRPADIGQIVFVSTTGTMTPSLPSRMLADMGFDERTRTVPLFGFGCGGGVIGTGLAVDLWRARPDRPVLLVCLELCSLAHDDESAAKKDYVAAALFSDGCAAMVIGADDGGLDGRRRPRLGAFGQSTWPGTVRMMGWDIGPTGYELVLARDIPAFVESDFAPVADDFLSEQHLIRAELAEPACHPGGGRVIDALIGYFDNDLPATRAILAEYGNMSSPTVLFVLDRLIQQGGLAGPTLMTALGPGFTGALGLVHP